MYLNDFFLHRNWTYLPFLTVVSNEEIAPTPPPSGGIATSSVVPWSVPTSTVVVFSGASARECSRIPSASPLLNAVTVTGKS